MDKQKFIDRFGVDDHVIQDYEEAYQYLNGDGKPSRHYAITRAASRDYQNFIDFHVAVNDNDKLIEDVLAIYLEKKNIQGLAKLINRMKNNLGIIPTHTFNRKGKIIKGKSGVSWHLYYEDINVNRLFSLAKDDNTMISILEEVFTPHP